MKKILLVFISLFLMAQEYEDYFQGFIGDPEVGVKWGYIDKTGKLVIGPEFLEVGAFSEGLAAVKPGRKWGYINKIGKMIIKPQFGRAFHFSEGLALIQLEKDSNWVRKWVYIDTNGKIVIDRQEFQAYGKFSDGFAKVAKKGKWGYIDKTGKLIIDFQFDKAGDFHEGKALVGNGITDTIRGYSYPIYYKYEYIDKSGKKIKELKPVKNRRFHEGLAAKRENWKWGYIDTAGQWVIKPQFKYAENFSCGLARVRKKIKGKTWSFYIDKTGEIKAQFDSGRDFHKGLAAVEKNGKYGFIDTTGKLVIGLHFYWVGNFSEGLAPVKFRDFRPR
jgi:hypothetical protein